MTAYDPPPYARPAQGVGAPANQAPHGPLSSTTAGIKEVQRQDSTEMPQFGATFYPGGVDDYYMPEVIAPAPQRVMPEVPQNMQQDLQRMELEARSVEPRRDSAASPGAVQHRREPSLSNVMSNRPGAFGQQYQQARAPAANDYSPASNFSPFADSAGASPQWEKKSQDLRDLPSFSPFPKVKGEHIPPSDEEKEAILADSREYVLHSNDPTMQICWARDVLSYVEIASEAAIREAEAARRPGDRDIVRPATPKVEHELRVDALNIVDYLAKQGHPEALFIVSKWLEFGKFGKRQDKKEAYSGYASAAKQGWGRAEYRIGMLYENSNDVKNALAHYNAGLAMKDSAASYRLGMISLLGQHNQPKDLVRGLSLIHTAADSSDEDAPQGSFVYGMIIARDLPDVQVPEGVLSYDLSVARQYIEKAAYLGFAKAQLKMGQAYELCQLGCEFNPAMSLHYYGLAARQGQPEACLGVSRWFLFGYEGTFSKNEELAFKFARLAATAQLPTGEFAMGYYYEIGIHVEKDLREARKWYELAAEHGNKDASGRLDGLSQAKSLTKKDHETTALTRIKSQHGSQRGKRPERFQKPAAALPTLAEGEPSPGPSPKVSPQPSPRTQPQDRTDMPDPTRHSTMSNKPPAFTINLPDRSRSTAPYPEDDRPPPLNLQRPKSTAPYPEDDMASGAGRRPSLSPHYNSNIRPSAGPIADRPGSAFGIRTQSPGHNGTPGPAIRPSSSAGQLVIPPTGADPYRGRPASTSWQPQVPAGYRQPSPGSGGPRNDLRPVSAQYDRPASAHYDRPLPSGGYDQRLSAGPAANSPAQNRLTKTNPNSGKPGAPGQFPMGNYAPRESSLPPPPNPGRDYGTPGPRLSSRPEPHGGRASAAPGNVTSPTMVGGHGHPAHASTMGGPMPQGGRIASSARPAVPLKDKPMDLGGGPGRASAPPQQGGGRPGKASPAPSTSTTNSAPAAPGAGRPSKPAGTGPSTFEEMGIPQGKNDDDCVIM